jgi:hypothetical protein
VTRAPGARHASVRFVTGGLDLVADRIAFLDLAQRANKPILLILRRSDAGKVTRRNGGSFRPAQRQRQAAAGWKTVDP